jgi:UDP-N-acetylmuramate--alanine ligase
MELGAIKAVYFIGVGGIGMSALARFFHARGVRVSGYDRTATALTKQLEVEGIVVYYDEDVARAPKDVQLVVYTPAIPAAHQELQYYLQADYSVVKRSDVLKIITESSLNICVAGTHGKTTISTMAAYLLQASGHGCNAFLGGISVNYDTNFWSSSNPLCVVEADEYDRSFHKLCPDYAVISSMDPDHLDIYDTAENVEEAFIEFTHKIRKGGVLIYKYGLKRAEELKGDVRFSYHVQDSNADVYAENLRIDHGGYQYDVVIKNSGIRHCIKDLSLRIGGLHNVENSLPAILLGHLLKLSDDQIVQTMRTFSGVKRRFEYWIAPGEGDCVMIDDYAHHPEELRALISGARSLLSEYGLLIIFQPHLYSRTKDQVDGFAKSLDLADSVVLLPIYPARELPMEGVSSHMIIERMQLKDKQVMEKEMLLKELQLFLKHKKRETNKTKWVVITAGAGDIDAMLPQIKAELING